MKNKLFKRILIALLIIFITIFIDQISKNLISKNMELYSFKSIVPGVLNFRYITNYGFLLGIGSNLNDGRTFNGVVIITIIALLVLLGYFVYILFQDSTKGFLLITFSILIGGAWGNFLDRLIKGKVIDFLEIILPFNRIGRFYIGSTPIFNMADLFVTLGIILLLIYYFIVEPKENRIKKEKQEQEAKDEFENSNNIYVSLEKNEENKNDLNTNFYKEMEVKSEIDIDNNIDKK